MWISISLATGIFALGELIVNKFIFRPLKAHYSKKQEKSSDILGISESAFKGVLERLMLFVALHYQLGTILVAFGALKLGTRLKDENVNSISNDYFLVGNFSSILISIGYMVLHLKIIERLT